MSDQTIRCNVDGLETTQALAALLRGDADSAAHHLQRMAWPLLVGLAKGADCPSEGPLAWAIWRKSNSEPDPKEAVFAMSECGYVPFQGYPLVRQSLVIQIVRTEIACADGSTFITYTFRDDLPNHLRHRAYDQALARLKADWPDTSQVYVATTGQGYAVRCPREYLNCTRNNDSPCSRCSRP
ncbi:MAG: hypothetical protein IT318_08305 [Anaerolineales bacterium]|nr:hypothetical protein [Anaerolineales bacterium]